MTSQLLILITLLVLYLISYYFIVYIEFSFSVLFSQFRLLPSFLFPLWFPLLFSSVSSFVPASSSLSSSSFPFSIFLFLRYLYPLFVFLFTRFCSLFSPLLPAAASSLLSASPALLPPPSSAIPLLLWSIFSSFSFSLSLSSLGFPPPSAFLLLFLFSLLLSHPTFSPLHLPLFSSAPLPSSSSASWILSFFVFSSSVGSFFFPFSFLFLTYSFT